MTSSDFIRIRKLASPAREWFAFVDYEFVWEQTLCAPEIETTLDQFLARLKACEQEVSNLRFRIQCALSHLKAQV
jgi:hypothetical protein